MNELHSRSSVLDLSTHARARVNELHSRSLVLDLLTHEGARNTRGGGVFLVSPLN